MTGICQTPANAEGTTYNDSADLAQNAPTPVPQHPDNPVDGSDTPIGIPPNCNSGGENSVGTPTDPDSEVDCVRICDAGMWETGKSYVTGPDHRHLVCHNDIAYLCQVDHTSASADEPGVGGSWETYWKQLGAEGSAGVDGIGFDWTGPWNNATNYTTGNKTNQTQYSVVSHVAHTGDPEWAITTVYAINDKVYSDNVHYTCILAHTSASTDEPGTGANWTTYWAATDTTTLPLSSFVCIQDHDSSVADTEPVYGPNWPNYWETIVVGGGQVGFEAMVSRGKWEHNEVYLKNDTVEHEGSSYVCDTSHTSKQKKDGTKAAPGNEPELIVYDPDAGIIQRKFNDLVTWITKDYNDPTPYWKLLSKGGQEDKGFLGGAFDWLDKLVGRDVSDLIQGAVGIAAVNYAANRFLETDIKEYEVRFDGDYGYATTPTNPNLDDIVEDICQQAGIAYDVSELPSTPISFAIGEITNYRSILEMLSQAYQFDIITTFDSGRIVKFRPRSTTSVATISQSELGWSTGFAGEAPIQSKRLQGTSLPRSIELSYFSSAFSEKRLTQSAIMRTYPEGQQFKIELALSLDDAYARDLCDVILMNAHLERNEYAFTTSLKYLELEAGDVITLQNIGDIRLTSVRTIEDNDGLIQFTAVDAGVTTSQTGSINGPSGTGPQPVVPLSQETMTVLTQSRAIPLDLPSIVPNDSTPRIHFAVYGIDQEVSWPGARVYLSRDDGATYAQVGTTYAQSDWGLVEDAIPAPGNFNQVDETTTITVNMKRGVLTSAADDIAFYNGVNKVVVGQELIYFKTVNDLGSGVYELTDLLRGRRGTDIYMTTHNDDESLVVINENLVEVPLNQDDFNRPMKFKVQTIGLTQTGGDEFDITPRFQNFKGWTVANGTLDIDDTTDAFVGFWTRRYKWDPELINGRGTLPDPDLGGYKVLILDSSDDSIVREMVVTTPQFAYTAAQQVEDFGSIQTTLKVSIVVMSRTIGPGHPTVLTYGL